MSASMNSRLLQRMENVFLDEKRTQNPKILCSMVTVDNNDTVLYGCIGTATIRAKNATLKKELDKLELDYLGPLSVIT